MHARRLIRAVLAPHHAEDAEFSKRRLAAAEQRFDSLVFVRRDAVASQNFGSYSQGRRGGHGGKYYCRIFTRQRKVKRKDDANFAGAGWVAHSSRLNARGCKRRATSVERADLPILNPMKSIIVGTAGHIDHGKTALVKALTGIDADRLEEEKRRGITIDLGFAHLQLAPALRLGFVDVPGHERFVKNMLAGVGGIDLLLFAIAADESIKPQTREHFDICRLLGISRGVIALTKADLVDDDLVGLVRLEVEELVAGSFLEGAPIVPVSSLTGAGLNDLRRELARVAAVVPEKNAAGHFRLPIDRVFSVKGFGTVATGTLLSGSVAAEQTVELYPAGRRLRVRGVQVHGSSAGRAVAGQ